jgi:hypothetical protein
MSPYFYNFVFRTPGLERRSCGDVDGVLRLRKSG